MKNLKNALLLKHLYQLKHLRYRYTSIVPYQEKEPNFSLPNTIENLKIQAQNCHLCLLSKQRHKVVFGKGSQQAIVMIVGDIPSNSDNHQGEIFTDRAGTSLRKMIENVLKLRQEEVYLTNLLKCQPKDTQNISSAHTHTCYPYLQKEIALIQPQIIIALGELAYEYLSDDHTQPTMETVHGNIYKKENYMIIPTYHPNYLLRNPSKKSIVFEDLKKIKVLIDTLKARL